MVQTTDLSSNDNLLPSAGTGTVEEANGPVSGDAIDQRGMVDSECETSVRCLESPFSHNHPIRVVDGNIGGAIYNWRKSLAETVACPWQSMQRSSHKQRRLAPLTLVYRLVFAIGVHRSQGPSNPGCWSRARKRSPRHQVTLQCLRCIITEEQCNLAPRGSGYHATEEDEAYAGP